MDAHDISSAQYNILRILRGAAGPLPTMTIRDRMMDREPSITRLIDRLEGRGLVKRVPSEEDRRRVDCHLSPAGRALVDSLDEPVDTMDRELMKDLRQRELETVTALLDRIAPEG